MIRVRTVPVATDLLDRVLSPYFEHCRYLLEATCEFRDDDGPGPPVRGRGRFSIPTSCYIADTGHFNAVEFNLCYNQILYVTMAQCVVSDVLAPFAAMSLEEYFRRQLPDVLIHEFQSIFRRPMRGRSFEGEFTIESATERPRHLRLDTRVRFWEEGGGASEGRVAIALVDGEARAAASGDAEPSSAGS